MRRVLRRVNARAYRQYNELEKDVRRLAKILSRTPSLLDERSFGSEVHSVDTLIEILHRDGCDQPVLLPTKVSVGRTLMVSRFNLFGFLQKVCSQHEALEGYRVEVRRCWELMIFSLLIEDVYQVIFDRDKHYPARIRRGAALDLIQLWEHRVNLDAAEYATTVIELWRVRKTIAPVFGTMYGTMELLTLSSLLPERWHDFLEQHGDNPEVFHAVEEFIFGLSYEEIQSVHRGMSNRGISAVGRDDLRAILGSDDDIGTVTSVDPREMYRFYQTRAKRAAHRAVAGEPGPKSTLEELLLVHLLGE